LCVFFSCVLDEVREREADAKACLARWGSSAPLGGRIRQRRWVG